MSWLWWIQIGADILLIGAVVLLLGKLNRLGGLRSASSTDDLDEFIDEAGQLAKEFDRLLAEKRQLVGTTLKTLDQRIDQLNTMLIQAEKTGAKLQKAQAEPRQSKPAPAKPAGPVAGESGPAVFRRKVEELSRLGRTPAQIAEATGRPRGEVELVLGLAATEQ